MMKKGYTLVELLGVIALLSVIFLITGVLITQSLKNAKEKAILKQNDMLKNSLSLWASSHNPLEGMEYHITLSQLKNEGLVDSDIKNPNTKVNLANDIVLKVKSTDGVLSYEIDSTGSCTGDYSQIPKLTFDDVVFVEIKTTYTDVKAVSDVSVTSSGSVNTNQLGTNYITYTATKNGYCNKGIKNVVVVDTTAPVLSFSDLTISLSQVNTYNYLTGVTATDNSGVAPTITYKKTFPAVKGTHSVEYTAEDASGNIVIKHRKVVVN